VLVGKRRSSLFVHLVRRFQEISFLKDDTVALSSYRVQLANNKSPLAIVMPDHNESDQVPLRTSTLTLGGILLLLRAAALDFRPVLSMR
jgi:hypothetical protein